MQPEERDAAHLWDMWNAATLIDQYTAGLERQHFADATEVQDAVVRRFEILSLAAGKVSGTTRGVFPKVPWDRLIAMGNVMIQDYRNVDLDAVWDAVQRDIPKLIEALRGAASPGAS